MKKYILIIFSLFLFLGGCISKEDREKYAEIQAADYFVVTCLKIDNDFYKFIASKSSGGYYSYSHLLEEDETGIHLARCNK